MLAKRSKIQKPIVLTRISDEVYKHFNECRNYGLYGTLFYGVLPQTAFLVGE